MLLHLLCVREVLIYLLMVGLVSVGQLSQHRMFLAFVGMLSDKVLLLYPHHWSHKEEKLLWWFVLLPSLRREIARDTVYHRAWLRVNRVHSHNFILDVFLRNTLKTYWLWMGLLVILLAFKDRICKETNLLWSWLLKKWRSGAIANRKYWVLRVLEPILLFVALLFLEDIVEVVLKLMQRLKVRLRKAIQDFLVSL